MLVWLCLRLLVFDVVWLRGCIGFCGSIGLSIIWFFRGLYSIVLFFGGLFLGGCLLLAKSSAASTEYAVDAIQRDYRRPVRETLVKEKWGPIHKKGVVFHPLFHNSY